MTTPQTQAIQVVNGLMSVAQQLMGLYTALQQLDAQWTDNSVATILAAMGTTALNADGTPGAADGTPNPAHPLNLATYSNLNRAISSNQIAQLKTIVDEVVTYINGGAVTTQAGARAILNVAVGG